MSRKRKRGGKESSLEIENKRFKPIQADSTDGKVLKKALLSQYYLKVQTLREYLLSKLPASSRVRRKKILALKSEILSHNVNGFEPDHGYLARHLDQTLVGVREEDVPKDERWKQWNCFSQRPDVSDLTVRTGDGDVECSQSEIVDFTIWQLFKNSSRLGTRLQHLLCQGFRREVNFNAINRDENPLSAIPGLISTYPNHHVTMMKGFPWPQVLALMGKEGQRMMIDLILDCGIFVALETGHGNYIQLSGTPLGDQPILPGNPVDSDIRLVETPKNRGPTATFGGKDNWHLRADLTPSRILFVRNRILYARAALNTQGNVNYGFRHIHVLNRCLFEVPVTGQKPPEYRGQNKNNYKEHLSDEERKKTIHVMMYIFPREFGLHNVFTSSVDPHETVQPLKDYTLREEEIKSRFGEPIKRNCGNKIKVPRRLRTLVFELVKKLRISHGRCSYEKLLDHYCTPVIHPITLTSATQQILGDGSAIFHTQINAPAQNETYHSTPSVSSSTKLPSREPALMDYATSTAQVSAFCCSVMSTIIPNEFWGEDDIQKHNKKCLMRAVDRFVSLRRFETVSLHDVVQGMKIQNILWLCPRHDPAGKMSQTDNRKRVSLFLEFVYYVFDSLLIPLIRSHFFVTESNVHRYRIFYFRQDVWRSLCEPQMTRLKKSMLEEMSIEDAQKVLNSRSLGFSQLRLLPKENGVRPIMNLKRRPLRIGHRNVLGSSINSILAPVYNMYTYEKKINPNRLGATIFSVGELYSRLKTFNNSLRHIGEPLFFAKVDVQSAFDTIPQSAVLRVMRTLPSESEYRISKHVEIKPGEGYRMNLDGQYQSRPIRKWKSLATSPNDFHSFEQNVKTDYAIGKKHTIFIENVVNQFRDSNELLDMLSQHVQHNMVKIGKKFYRQKQGIPQGSVLSSILCNYFYADLEARYLEFLNTPGSLLLRLVDDFLLITTSRQHAKKFLQIMHDGLPEYGVTVNPLKTLVNFEVSINRINIKRLIGNRQFPYCGNFIDVKTLNIAKDRERNKDMAIADTLTVEYSKTPGKSFQRKSLNAFKIQTHAMFLDTSFNSLWTVFSNLYDSFVETATKMWRYAKCLPVQKQPSSRLVVKTIRELISLAFILIKSKSNRRKYDGYRCAVTRAQVEWLALTAFRSVLFRKQARYRDVLAWLDERIQVLRDKKAKECGHVEGFIGTRRQGEEGVL